MSLRHRKFTLVVMGIFVCASVLLFYHPTVAMINMLHTHTYPYMYFPPLNLEEQEPSGEAVAVPILMYHGVRVEGELGPNTTRGHFIEQMEMLKRQGYETISVREYDLFREGQFVLPPQPIIITFDDGRKDSYYTVDEVFKKLGFKATIFIATARANADDPFYLSWDELKELKATGRWEIEAHGRHSHDSVPIDADGTTGRYLTSRIHDEQHGLESIEDFKERVREDYEHGIVDLYTHLGIDARYYAVPLNDYGTQDNSNYDGALEFNKELTKEYFKLAFIEVEEDESVAYETFYNYHDTDPYRLKRLEVRNMTADELKTALDAFAPSIPVFLFPALSDGPLYALRSQQLYGYFFHTYSELIVYASPFSSSNAARTLIGDRGWNNYSVNAQIVRDNTREASVLFYYSDEDNYIILDWDDSFVEISEYVDGIKHSLVHQPRRSEIEEVIELTAALHNGKMDVTFDGTELVNDESIHLTRGAAGIGTWDPNGGVVRVSAMSIEPIDEAL